MWNIIKDNNQDLSFAMDCLSIGAISVSEFKSWLEIVIRDNPIDDIPGYIFDILDSNNIKLDIYKILRFSLSTVLSKQERKAVYMALRILEGLIMVQVMTYLLANRLH